MFTCILLSYSQHDVYYTNITGTYSYIIYVIVMIYPWKDYKKN